MTTPASSNRFKGVGFQPVATPSTPVAGDGRLFLDTADGLLKWIDDAGTVTEVTLGPSGGGFSDPMTTRGDIIIRNASNVTARLGRGSASQVLTSDGTDIAWATPSSGTVQDHNEIAAAVLTNATSAGDAGNRSDHFTGAALSGNWTQEANALTTGPTVKYSMFGGVKSSGATHYRQAYTPSGAFRVEGRVWLYAAANQAGVGILIRDSGSGDASGDGMLAAHRWISGNNSELVLYSLDSGSYSVRQSVQVEAFGDAGGNALQPIYIAIERNGSNVWTAGYSLDRVTWINTATHSKTFTVAKLALRMDSLSAFGWDFIDVVS